MPVNIRLIFESPSTEKKRVFVPYPVSIPPCCSTHIDMEFAHPPPGPMGGPPPSFNMPPPMHGMPPQQQQQHHHQPRHGGHHQSRPFFRPPGGGYGGYQRAPNGMPLSQDDFDGKRLRKSVMRKTVDYNASIVNALEVCVAVRAELGLILMNFLRCFLQSRIWQRDWRDRRALQPENIYIPDMMPPPSYLDNPSNAITTKFVKTATNKMKCPIFTLAWTPEGRRLVTGASSGEFTLWNGLTFNFETILQV